MGNFLRRLIGFAAFFTLFFAFTFTVFSDSAEPDVYIPFDGNGDAILKGGKNAKGIIYGKSMFNEGITGQALNVKRHAYDQVTCYNIKNLPSINLAQGTISFWFKPNWNGFDDKKYEILRLRCGWKFRVYLVKNNKGGLDYSVCSPKQLQVYKKCPFKADQWQHITMTWNLKSGDSDIYVNGKLLGSKKAVEGSILIPQKWPGIELWLGERSSNNFSAKVGEGLYDDFKIFSKVLSKEEIKELTLKSEKDKEAKNLNIERAKPASSMPKMKLDGLGESDIALYKGENDSVYFDKNSRVNSILFWFKLKKEKYSSPVRFMEINAADSKISFDITGINGFLSVNVKSKDKSVSINSNYHLKLDELHHLSLNLKDGKYALYLDGALQGEEKAACSSFGNIDKITIGGKVSEISDLLALKKAFPASGLPSLLKNEKKLAGIERLIIQKPDKLETGLWSLKDAEKKTEGARKRICLDGIWRVIPTNDYSIYPPSGKWGFMRVPGSYRSPLYSIYKEKKGKLSPPQWAWNKQPLIKYRAGWYQRTFKVPVSMDGKNIFINFKNIVGDYGRIYINGTLVDSFTNDSPSYTAIPNPMRINVTKLIKKGENTLTVFVDRKWSKLWRGSPSIQDHGEIELDDVWLESGPSTVQIANILAFPSYRNKEVLFKVKILNPDKLKSKAKLTVKFSFKGKEEKEFTHEFDLNGTVKETINFKMSWSDPKLWDFENPNLYKLTASLYDGNEKLLDTALPVNFGFREFWVENGTFYMNGNEARLRMWSSPSYRRLLYYFGTPEGIKQYFANLKRLGYDSTRCNPIKGLESQVGWEIKFNEADKQGFYQLQPVPPYEGIVPIEKYRRHIEKYIEAFGNHPSIIMWYTDFNTCSYPWNQDPAKLNDTEYVPKHKAGSIKLAKAAEKVVHQYDPSRETFQHAGGNTGKIFGSMNYQAFGVPLQEREDWPKQWSASHTQPLMVAECGFPYPEQFKHFDLDPRRGSAAINGKKPENVYLVTEHAARFFGDEAFKKAKLPSIVYDWRNSYFSKWPKNYTDIKKLLLNNTVKAWRAYGVSALGHFPGGRDQFELFQAFDKMNVVYKIRDDVKNSGLKPDRANGWSETQKHLLCDYTKINKELMKVFQKVFNPLLVFLGGKTDDFTNKDHAFYSGEEFEKSVVVVNDRDASQKLEFKWKLLDKDNGKVLEENDFSKEIAPGKIAKFPIKLKAPKVYKRMEAALELEVLKDDSLLCEDKMKLQFFPKHKPVDFKNVSAALYDPVGQTAKMLKEAGFPFEKVNKLSQLKGKNLLIIGKNALGDVPPDFLKKLDESGMIENGLKVLIFEQKQCHLGNLVFERPSQRTAFIRKKDHPAIEGLLEEDFSNWRGGTDTVPEMVVSDENSPHYPHSKWKCGNNGIVAGWVIRKPQYGNFTPILDCGFNLMNSPLLELKKGRGLIVFCQLDATHRYLKDPVATKIIDNLLSFMGSPFVPIKGIRTAYIGGKEDMKILDRMGAEINGRINKIQNFNQLKNYHVIIVGKGSKGILDKKKDIIKKYLEYGGGIFVMPGADLSFLPFDVERAETDMFKATLPEGNDPIFDNIPNADLYFRDIQKMQTISKAPVWSVKTDPAIILKFDVDRGAVVIFNIDPDKAQGLWSKEKAMRAMSKVLSNMHVGLAKDYRFFAGSKYRHNQIGNPYLELKNWELKTDPENKGAKNEWQKDVFSLAGFKKIKTPGTWERDGVTQKNPYYKYPPNTPRTLIRPYDGYAWYRTKFVLPAKWKGYKIYFKSGPIDDNDWTYVNGHMIGKTTFADNPKAYAADRFYEIPAKYLKFGEENTIAIRVYDKWGEGGLVSKATIEPERSIAKDSWSPYIDDLDFYDVDAFHNW